MDLKVLIPSIISILTGIGIVTIVLAKGRKLVKEIVELLVAYLDATDKEGEGGAKITPSELRRIIKEAKDIPKAIEEIGRRR